jgi:hypothetical protein
MEGVQMKRERWYLVIILMLTLLLSGAGMAQAALSWQTQPILGYYADNSTGDVVVTTDNGFVTIPHVSISGDPLEGVGLPGVTTFYYNPNVWDGAHWSDPVVWAYSGSGVYLDSGHTYSYTGAWDFLGSPGYSPYTAFTAANPNFSTTENFIMLQSGIGVFWLEDAGNWRYTETWTDNATSATITSARDFTLAPVPLPGALVLLGAGLVRLARYGRRKKALI